MTMTERQIQLAIARSISGATAIACPNYTPDGWWECDLWAVTKAGYVVEYEVKTTLADFRADALKTTTRYGAFDRALRSHSRTEVAKHAELAAGRGPTRFYFAVPNELVDQVTPLLPEWAGLVATSNTGLWSRGIWIVRDARRLHNRKAGVREVRQAQRRMCFRYWTELERADRAWAEIERREAAEAARRASNA